MLHDQIKMLENSKSNHRKKIAIVDFQNVVRKEISKNRLDAKFQNEEEIISYTNMVAKKIREMGNFDKIYLVTKSFNLNGTIKYKSVSNIIMWSFCSVVPEWSNKTCLAVVNGINGNDKEPDDRTLFILYDEFIKTTDCDVVIISNDNFGNFKSHCHRYVIVSLYWPKNLNETCQNCSIIPTGKCKFEKNETNTRYMIENLD